MVVAEAAMLAANVYRSDVDSSSGLLLPTDISADGNGSLTRPIHLPSFIV